MAYQARKLVADALDPWTIDRIIAAYPDETDWMRHMVFCRFVLHEKTIAAAQIANRFEGSLLNREQMELILSDWREAYPENFGLTGTSQDNESQIAICNRCLHHFAVHYERVVGEDVRVGCNAKMGLCDCGGWPTDQAIRKNDSETENDSGNDSD